MSQQPTVTKHQSTDNDIYKNRRLRARMFWVLLGVSRSTFYAGLRSGRYPCPDGYDGAMPFWFYGSVCHLLAPP